MAAPTTGQHQTGDVFVDSTGKYLCQISGTPGSWAKIPEVTTQPADNGYALTSLPVDQITSTLLTTSGTPIAVKIPIPGEFAGGINVTSADVYVTTGNGTPTAAENLVGLYNSAGVYVATSPDQGTAWGSTGIATATFTGGPFTLTGAFFYVVILSVASTSVTLATGAAAAAAGILNANLAATAVRVGTLAGSATALPTPIGTITATSTKIPFVGIK